MAGYWFFFGVAVGGPVVGILGGEYVVAVVGGPKWLVVVVAVLDLHPTVHRQRLWRAGVRNGTAGTDRRPGSW